MMTMTAHGDQGISRPCLTQRSHFLCGLLVNRSIYHRPTEVQGLLIGVPLGEVNSFALIAC
jgi:hypothetical protein